MQQKFLLIIQSVAFSVFKFSELKEVLNKKTHKTSILKTKHKNSIKLSSIESFLEHCKLSYRDSRDRIIFLPFSRDKTNSIIPATSAAYSLTTLELRKCKIPLFLPIA